MVLITLKSRNINKEKTRFKQSAFFFNEWAQTSLTITQRENRNAFTLVELLITVAILGILAAAAFPVYERIAERTASAALIASMNNFAKECSINTLSSNSSPIGIPNSIALTSISGTECSSGATLKNTTPFDGNLITGLECGSDEQDNINEVFCILTISPDGELSSAWGTS